MIRLSIIIPFYNVESYIAQCLDSVYDQDIPEEEYEVICVNDASPDHSRDIVLEYQKKHTNLVLVEHEVNKKLGAARNTGRRIARGEFIWNVDSDDMIAPNCLSEMLDCCEESGLDVLMFDYCVYMNGVAHVRGIKPWKNYGQVLSGKEFWTSQGSKNIGEICPVWTKLFRRDFLDEHNVVSPEINMGEDIPFSIKSILFSRRMIACNKAYYFYRENEASLTGELKKIPKPHAVYENSFVCGKYMDDLVRSIPNELTIVIESVIAIERYVVLQYEKYAMMMSNNDVIQLRKLCKRNFFSNLFVLRCLGKRNALNYLRFVVCGMKPRW